MLRASLALMLLGASAAVLAQNGRGIANERSYAYFIAQQLARHGAQSVFTYLPMGKGFATLWRSWTSTVARCSRGA